LSHRPPITRVAGNPSSSPVELLIRPATPADAAALLDLYRRVARHPGGLARLESEVTAEYVSSFLTRALAHGLGLVCEEDGAVIGEMHASLPGPQSLAHVLSDLTVAVAPDRQDRGVGRRLFTRFLEVVRLEMPQVTRVELIARESNVGAIALYASLGFRIEGRLRGRIRNTDGSVEDDVAMGWVRA
jgi:ribosomal protein S18 acetylase RimI-like enzyme